MVLMADTFKSQETEKLKWWRLVGDGWDMLYVGNPMVASCLRLGSRPNLPYALCSHGSRHKSLYAILFIYIYKSTANPWLVSKWMLMATCERRKSCIGILSPWRVMFACPWQEECDVLSVVLTKYLNHINYAEFKVVLPLDLVKWAPAELEVLGGAGASLASSCHDIELHGATWHTATLVLAYSSGDSRGKEVTC